MKQRRTARTGITEIFRQEALDHRFGAAVREGNPLRLSSSLTRWTLWLLLATVVAALLFGSTVSVGEFATGPAVIRVGDDDTCTVTAYLPARFLPDLRPGLSTRVLLTGLEAEQSITLDAFDPRIVPALEVRRILGGTALPSSSEPAVAVVRRLDSCTFRLGTREIAYADGMEATLEVRVRSRSILSSLIPGLASR